MLNKKHLFISLLLLHSGSTFANIEFLSDDRLYEVFGSGAPNSNHTPTGSFEDWTFSNNYGSISSSFDQSLTGTTQNNYVIKPDLHPRTIRSVQNQLANASGKPFDELSQNEINQYAPNLNGDLFDIETVSTGTSSVLSFVGSAKVNGYSDFDWYQSRATFDFSFRSSNAFNFELTGSFSESTSHYGGAYFGVGLKNVTAGETIYFHSITDIESDLNFSELALEAGEYEFSLFTSAFGPGFGTGELDFLGTVTELESTNSVPLPASLLLFVSAITSLLGVKKKRS